MAKKKNSANKKVKTTVTNASSNSNGISNNLANKRLNGVDRPALPNVESFTSLTKPQLFSLYDEDITKSEDSDIYSDMKKNDGQSEDSDILEMKSSSQLGQTPSILSPTVTNGNGVSTTYHAKRSAFSQISHLLLIIIVLSLSGVGYHELSRHLRDNDLLHPELASKPLLVVSNISKVITLNMIPDWVGFSLEGIIFGLLIPAIDYFFNIKPRPTSTSSIIRSVNAMLGVTFGIRKIEWSSSSQAAGAWALLNVIMWLFFDGTFSMFWSCAGIGFISCAAGYANITDFSQLLYFMDFYFLGLMLFGKLGRFLLSL